MTPRYTAPGLSKKDADAIISLLQVRLSAINDLHLTLKHIHWNVVGPSFIGVHTMLDPMVETARLYADQLAERIATLGGSPAGTPAAIERDRDWKDYSIGRGTTQEHLGALDLVFVGLITDHRKAIEESGTLDPVTEDLLIAQTGELEKYHWFVRAHLEDQSGRLSTEGATSEKDAAAKAE